MAASSRKNWTNVGKGVFQITTFRQGPSTTISASLVVHSTLDVRQSQYFFVLANSKKAFKSECRAGIRKGGGQVDETVKALRRFFSCRSGQ